MTSDAIDFWFSTGSNCTYLTVSRLPAFVVCGELFRGDDRLDDALSWFRHGRLSS